MTPSPARTPASSLIPTTFSPPANTHPATVQRLKTSHAASDSSKATTLASQSTKTARPSTPRLMSATPAKTLPTTSPGGSALLPAQSRLSVPRGPRGRGKTASPTPARGWTPREGALGVFRRSISWTRRGAAARRPVSMDRPSYLANNECLALCWANQQKIRNMCYNVPTGCKMLAPHLACQECLPGYSFNFGVCEPSRLLRQ